MHVLENGRHLLAGEHDGKTRRSFGTHEIVEPRQLRSEYVPIEEEERAERLILRGRGHVPIHSQTREECRHLRRGHVCGVTLAMEQDEPADPEDIRLLDPWPQMPRADRDPNTVEEPRRREVRGALFRDTREGFELSEATLEHARAATIAPIHIRVEIAWPSQTRMCAPRSRR